MREPRRDLFGNDLPARWEDSVETWIRELPSALQPWGALAFFIGVGLVFALGLYVLVYGVNGLLP